MAQVTVSEDALRHLLRQAVADALEEQRDLLRDVIADVLEDVGLTEAIREGRETDLVGRDAIDLELNGSP